MMNKKLITSILSLLMVNATMIPVSAKPVIETEKGEKQEMTSHAQEQMIILSPATPETPGAVQIVPLKAYIALKGEASLKDKSIIEVLPESATPSTGNKDSLKDDDKSALTQEADYFVVLPEGEELSAQEMEKIEGEVFWKVVAVGALGGVGLNAYENVRAGRPWHQNWGSSAAIGAGAVFCAATRNPTCSSIGASWGYRRSWGW